MNFHEKARAYAHNGVLVSADDLYEACYKHYDRQLVAVYEMRDREGDFRESPYRIHIRTDFIKPELLAELEAIGMRCERGTTCNEWETSIVVTPDPQIAVHPPHMVVRLTKIPESLKQLTPLWYDFLQQTEFLGHLMGTMSNGITVPKQAFGECQTSIVLETYRRAYGPEYKAHQCVDCVNYELGFKEKIVAHDFDGFQNGLVAFVSHFINAHPEAYKMVTETPFSYKRGDYSGNMEWRDHQGRLVIQQKSGRYSDGYL